MSTSKRKVIVYIAASLDGFIAKKDDTIDFLSVVEKENEDYGYYGFVETVDTVIMGRKTYEKVLSFPVDFPHKERDCFVLSQSKKGKDNNVTFYDGNVKDLVDELKKKEGKNIFVDGGAGAVHALREQNLIDEYVISIIPVLLGNGIRLFKDLDHQQTLELVESQSFDTGLVQVKYRVK
ncbi:dihydrofolate reductase family protein [Mangrovibacillus cuniculi]|uniref:Dihydrofolate reductase n=1 Tax=Mangrovibacillus cuniculi TaxID=2593652 RepID=A0A7S8HGW2_9BACI|nr:dihydrofolate reductase family protein [Mangrovibacillus cuniculi]QPC47855.1 dihydrofolate reductase [Mangrovibacillus cuniculi]